MLSLATFPALLEQLPAALNSGFTVQNSHPRCPHCLPDAARATPQEARKISTSGSLILRFHLMEPSGSPRAFVGATDFPARCWWPRVRAALPVQSRAIPRPGASGFSGFSSCAQGGVSGVCLGVALARPLDSHLRSSTSPASSSEPVGRSSQHLDSLETHSAEVTDRQITTVEFSCCPTPLEKTI